MYCVTIERLGRFHGCREKQCGSDRRIEEMVDMIMEFSDGKIANIRSFADFLEKIDEYMGYEAKKYLYEMTNDMIEELNYYRDRQEGGGVD